MDRPESRTRPEFHGKSMSGSKPGLLALLYLTVSFTIIWCSFIFLGGPFGATLGTTTEQTSTSTGKEGDQKD